MVLMLSLIVRTGRSRGKARWGWGWGGGALYGRGRERGNWKGKDRLGLTGKEGRAGHNRAWLEGKGGRHSVGEVVVREEGKGNPGVHRGGRGERGRYK